MARVDFSNARIEFLNKNVYNASYWALTGLGGTNFYKLYDSEGIAIASGNTPTVVPNDKGFTVTRTGTFTASGTEFYLHYNTTPNQICRISNIAFMEGDTYSFDIKVDVP